MTQRIHFFAGLLATLTIASFFSATLFSELLGSPGTISNGGFKTQVQQLVN